jgi:hypothetical protein
VSEARASGVGARIAIGLGAMAGMSLALVAALASGATAGWLALGAWIAPGVVAAAMTRDWRAWRPRDPGRTAAAVVVAAWAPAVLIAVAAALAAAGGLATWDPGGEGLRAWWSETQAGRAALGVSDLKTLALGQAGLVLTAPLYGLPAGLGITVWGALAPPSRRLVLVALLVGSLAALGALPAGPPLSLAGLVFAGAAWAALAVSFGRWGPWPTAVGLAALHGLPGLGPLLAVGPAWAVGWGSWPALGLAVVAAVVVMMARGR